LNLRYNWPDRSTFVSHRRIFDYRQEKLKEIFQVNIKTSHHNKAGFP